MIYCGQPPGGTAAATHYAGFWQTVQRGAHSKQRLSVLMTPWADRIIAVIAIIPFLWLTYSRMRSFGVTVPRVALGLQGLLFIGTMVVRRTPRRVSRNPWFWVLTFIETYWVILVFAVIKLGRPLAPAWIA